MPEPRVSNWHDAIDLRDLETLQLVLVLVREHYELFGRFMTARELQAALRHPGA